MAVKVGTFQKSVDAAPAVQEIDGLGFLPEVLFLWSSAQTTLASWTPDVMFTHGFSDGITSRSTCIAEEDNGDAINPPRCLRILSSYAICFIDYAGTVQARASVTFDSNGFTLNWMTNNASAYYVHYMAVGGDDITNKAIVDWDCTAAAGNQSVDTVGFRPDLVIHLTADVTTLDAPADAANAGIGAMDVDGGQYGIGYSGGWYEFGGGIAISSTHGSRNRCLQLGTYGVGVFSYLELSYVSMDAAGFTVFKDNAPPDPVGVASLCLRGGLYHVGWLNESDTGGNQPVTGVGFQPEGVLFITGQGAETTGSGAGFTEPGIGGMDGTSQAAIAAMYPHTNPSEADAAARDDRCLYAGAETAATTDDAVYVSFDADGFTINWTTHTNDSPQHGFIAFDIGPYTPPVGHICPPEGHRPPLTYSLTLKPSVISSVGSVAPMDLTDLARDWKHSTRLQGGYWTGTFSAPLSKRTFEAFDTWLGCHVEERSGGTVTWEGCVYEMELTLGGVVRRKSLDAMFNRARADYTSDDVADPDKATAWYESTPPQARYGVREEVLSLGFATDAQANAVAQTYLARHAYPWDLASAFSPGDGLKVTCCGYGFLANWVHVTEDSDVLACWNGWQVCVADGLTVANWIGGDYTPYAAAAGAAYARYSVWIPYNTSGYEWAYLGTLCADGTGTDHVHVYQDPFLVTNGYNTVGGPAGGATFANLKMRGDTAIFIQDVTGTDLAAYGIAPGVINPTGVPVARETYSNADSPTRAWEAIQAAANLGDVYDNPWRVYIGIGRRLHFEQISTAPVAYILDGKWRSDPAGSPINPWQMRPGVGKILNWDWSPARTGYWLPDSATFLIEEIEVAADGTITPRISAEPQTENLLYYLAGLTVESGGRKEWSWTPPPNWNVEANEMNPIGNLEGGAANEANWHGYWTPEGWVTDWSIDLHPYY